MTLTSHGLPSDTRAKPTSPASPWTPALARYVAEHTDAHLGTAPEVARQIGDEAWLATPRSPLKMYGLLGIDSSEPV